MSPIDAPPQHPGPVYSIHGRQLPVMAMRHADLLTVNDADIPLLQNAVWPGVHFKPLRLDVEAGHWVLEVTFSPGTVVPLHYHTGTLDAFTMRGSWYYREYPDQVQTSGSYLYKAGASALTLCCPAANEEDTVVLFSIKGAKIVFDDDGNFDTLIDAAMIKHLTGELAAAQGHGPVTYIDGGTNQLTTQNA